ncbi:hypothetical protein LOK49_LG01G00864 [Camellia lanceoleosa]|uniref:Uncharacterized protein n=1 Tax=Camellia lanceoleosa TaxID=1840588 RepID=A0ACC0J3F5_9ERIC|nr:hypothetical protein LOK49_LG01G00864 [Camellia lanceoleosa]
MLPIGTSGVGLTCNTQMEEDSMGMMSVKEAVGQSNDHQVVKHKATAAKHQSFGHCFSFVEASAIPGITSLRLLDSKKLKLGIKKWAKTIATYARQVSGRFGSSRR